MPAADTERQRAALLDLRDEAATAASLVTALWLASQAPHLPQNERRALCAVADAVREKLEACLAAIDGLIGTTSAH